jgi:sporulation protein YlmC with PRC-barrel domain
MLIHIGTHVEATDGRVGEVRNVVVDTQKRRLTHLEVHPGGMLGVDRLLPIEEVAEASAERVALRIDKATFESFPPTKRAEHYNPPGAGEPYMDEFRTTSLPVVDRGVVSENEITVRGGERVEAKDGRIGKVDGVMIDGESQVITHLVMREGHLWHTRTVTIPLEHIDHAERDAIYLNLTKDEVEPLAADA